MDGWQAPKHAHAQFFCDIKAIEELVNKGVSRMSKLTHVSVLPTLFFSPLTLHLFPQIVSSIKNKKIHSEIATRPFNNTVL